MNSSHIAGVIEKRPGIVGVWQRCCSFFLLAKLRIICIMLNIVLRHQWKKFKLTRQWTRSLRVAG